MVRMAGGRLFHDRDTVTGKVRSPRVNRCTDGTTSVMVVDERRWRRPSPSAVHERSQRDMAALICWDIGMPECRYGIESVPGPATSESRGEAGWCVRSTWLRTRVGWQHRGWTTACPVDDWRHQPAWNCSSRPCRQPNHHSKMHLIKLLNTMHHTNSQQMNNEWFLTRDDKETRQYEAEAKGFGTKTMDYLLSRCQHTVS